MQIFHFISLNSKTFQAQPFHSYFRRIRATEQVVIVFSGYYSIRSSGQYQYYNNLNHTPTFQSVQSRYLAIRLR